jgi:AcrR family transcriptional regulator
MLSPYTAEMNQTVHSSSKKAKASKQAPSRTNDPDRTMANILDVATKEFGEKGLAGARIDEIAEATHTSKRMIYYYFGSKEGLYLAVLEDSYRRMRHNEALLHLEDLAPEEALRKLVAYTFDHHRSNESYIRLVMSENINRGQYLAQSRFIQDLNVPAIAEIRRIYDRGLAEGVFRPGLDPLEIHWAISSLAFFNVSNRHTFDLIFKCDSQTAEAVAHRRHTAVELVVRHLRAEH